MNTYGEKLKITVFGQSHAPAIGVVIDGFPTGFEPDRGKLSAFMARRAPGNSAYATPRKEADEVKIISGINASGKTSGAPICAVIENTNVRSGDYGNIEKIPRPAHADFSAYAKFGDDYDVRGGGQFSGRLTAPVCIAGGICMQYLEGLGISIGAHILSVGNSRGRAFCAENPEIDEISRGALAVLEPSSEKLFSDEILAARKDLDSVGGVIECAVKGLPAGIGEPMFGGIENRISQAVFAIPAVKGIEFGSGFSGSAMRGSENNDAFDIKDGRVFTKTNNHGGILGGISSGMPIVFRAAIKPTPSIAKEQESVNLESGERVPLKIRGRHDPCIVPRAVPVVEAAAAIAVCDMILEERA